MSNDLKKYIKIVQDSNSSSKQLEIVVMYNNIDWSSEEGKEILYGLASNPNCPQKHLETLYNTTLDVELKEIILQNPNCSKEFLISINMEKITKLLKSSNPESGLEILKTLQNQELNDKLEDEIYSYIYDYYFDGYNELEDEEIQKGLKTLYDLLPNIKSITINHQQINEVLTFDEILSFQKSLLGMPITNTVYSYAVELVRKTRPNTKNCPEEIRKFIDFGAGPRASQYLILGSKMHAVLRGKYSPDIEDVRAVSEDVLRHRLVKNYKDEAEGVTIEKIIQKLF